MAAFSLPRDGDGTKNGDVMASVIASGEFLMDTSPKPLKVNDNRQQLFLTNKSDSVDVWVGGAEVEAGTGLPIRAGGTIALAVSASIGGAGLFGVVESGTATVAYLELG